MSLGKYVQVSTESHSSNSEHMPTLRVQVARKHQYVCSDPSGNHKAIRLKIEIPHHLVICIYDILYYQKSYGSSNLVYSTRSI